MLPLHPPNSVVPPGYPARQRLLADPRLRRHALTVLAAAVLAGCSDSASASAKPQPERHVETELAGTRALDEVIYDQEREPEITVSLGNGCEPEPPETTELMGDVTAPEPPEPHVLLGMMSLPNPILEIEIPDEDDGPDADV